MSGRTRLAPGGGCGGQWQQAYSGGVYSLHQTTDGGYLLAGDSNLELSDETPLVPWLAKVDANGALVWQEQDYQSLPSTGRPLSEYFAASTLTPAGPLAIGSTENYSNGRNELLGVQTDPNGSVASCSQIHTASPLTTTNPGLAQLTPGFTTNIGITSESPSPVQVQSTTATATASQC